jgi:type IV secretory pathway TrbL component
MLLIIILTLLIITLAALHSYFTWKLQDVPAILCRTFAFMGLIVWGFLMIRWFLLSPLAQL